MAVGAMTICSSVLQFAMLPIQGIGQGSQPISSYNFGARNAERVRQTFYLLLKICMSYSIVLYAVIMLMPRLFAEVFSNDPALLDYAVSAIRIYCGALFVFGIQISAQLTFVSIGNAPCSIIVAVVRKFLLLLPLIYIMPHLVSDPAKGVFMAEPVADIIAACFTGVLFFTQFRKALDRLESPD